VKTKTETQELIRIDLPKSCFLLLTHEEYRRGIWRGKNERRRLANEARLGGRSLDELAKSQNVQPMADVRALFGSWPGEEDDGFEENIEELRKSDLGKIIAGKAVVSFPY
jgi:hypothetical protein